MPTYFTSRCAIALAALLALGLPGEASAGDYRDQGGEPLPWNGGGSTKDGYPVPQPPPQENHRSYKDDGPPPPVRRTAECRSKFGIQRSLNAQGWHEFDAVEIRGPVAYMTAVNDRGRRFDIQVDSCTGSVIEAHPFTVTYERPYYYEPRPAVGLYFGGGYGYGHHRWR